MPNHTVFPKYSQKEEIRQGSALSGCCFCTQGGVAFALPAPARGFKAPNGRGCWASLLSTVTVVRESKVPYSLGAPPPLGSGEICAYCL